MSKIPKHVFVRALIFAAAFSTFFFIDHGPLFFVSACACLGGSLLNLIVVAANDWRMPVMTTPDEWNESYVESGHSLMNESTTFPWLADRFILKLPRKVMWYSFGDIIIWLGMLGIGIDLIIKFIF